MQSGERPEQETAAVARDAERWRAIEPYLQVVRDGPREWTCWLELKCIPFRSLSTKPEDIADKLVQILREQRPVLVSPQDNTHVK